MKSWRRLVALGLGGLATIVLVAGLVFWASGYFVTLQQNGGDRSQSSPIDPSPAPPAPPLPRMAGERVENVVLVLGDGMGFSQVMAARSELVGLNRKLLFERFPVTGWQTTHSRNAVYTDSASSASSLATGHKVEYGALSVSADGRELTTLFEAAIERGMAVGVVTDSYLWDATAAAFLAHAPERDRLEEIALQMVRSGADLLIGEEDPDLDADRPTAAGPSILEAAAAAGFLVARSADAFAELAPTGERPLLALFPSRVIADPERPPLLSDLAAAALARFAENPGGYLLLVESEEPDSGSHNRDLRRIVEGVRQLEAVAALAVERALADRSTLVLVTGDHESGGMALLHGDAEHRLGIRFATISHTAEPVPIYAFGAGAERFGGVLDNTEIALALAEALGLDLSG